MWVAGVVVRVAAAPAAAARGEEREQPENRTSPHARRAETSGAGLMTRPAAVQHDRDRSYLTVVGMPLILPAFRSLYCVATAP